MEVHGDCMECTSVGKMSGAVLFLTRCLNPKFWTPRRHRSSNGRLRGQSACLTNQATHTP